MLLSASLLVIFALQGTSAQVDPTAALKIADGPIKLHLAAAYGPGLVRPSTGPTLTARRLNQKKITCQLRSVLGVKARAATVSMQSAIAPTLAPQAAPAVLTAAAVAATAAPAGRTACRGELDSGRYNLIASYIEGATFPQWNCYPVAPGDTAAAASLDPALSLPMETQVVSAAVAYRMLVCSLQLCMHSAAVTAVPVGLLVTQCQLLHRLCMPDAASMVCDYKGICSNPPGQPVTARGRPHCNLVPDLRNWGTLVGPLGTLMSPWLAGYY